MSLVSNIKAEMTQKRDSLQEKLSSIRDSVQSFDEHACASGKSALGRYSSKETIGVLKKMAELTKGLLR